MAYLKIIRPINLLMIVITQLLFWFCIIKPVHGIYGTYPLLAFWQVLLLILSTVLIAAGGYVINDYYDLPIDLINKPDKVIVSKTIDDDSAFNYFNILTLLGLFTSIFVAFKVGNYKLAVLPVLIASMLWFYAQSLKRMFLIGNLVVSIATAAVFLLLICFSLNWNNLYSLKEEYNQIILFGKGFMAFAFLVSMLRELVKDMQDKKGDEAFESKTIPIVLGMKGAKLIAMFWLVLIFAGIVYVQTGLNLDYQWLPFGYLILFIQLPCLLIGYKLLKAENSRDYGKISTWVKALMLFGILSMIYIGTILVNYGKEIDSWL